MPRWQSTRGVLAFAAVLALVGCGGEKPHEHQATQAETVTISEQWAKAAESGMTAVFGVLANSADHDARIVSATSPAAGRMELHEVVADAGGAATMQPKPGGIVVGAGGTHKLAPGADHLMLFDIGVPLVPGSDVEVVLRFEDGSSLPFAAQVRDFPGATENYTPGSNSSAPPNPHSGG